MKGRLIDLTVGMDGLQRVTVALDGDMRETFSELHAEDVEITVKKYRKKRSLDANAMLWVFCKKIADVAGCTKEDVYRDHIRAVGEYTPLPIREDAVERFNQIWSEHGIGWFAEVVDNSKLDGYKLVFAYNGSSTYDTKSMSRLLDNVLQDAKALGIETMSEAERSLLLDAWASC